MNDSLVDKLFQIKKEVMCEYVPQIFNLSQKESREAFQKLYGEHSIIKIIDDFESQTREYDLVREPLRMKGEKMHDDNRTQNIQNIDKGVWVYYPWRHTAVHCVDKKKYQEIRLARNQNLITVDEQIRLQKSRICVLGLNVGYAGALVCALEGVGIHFDLVDLDTLSVSNLNRFPAGLCDIGVNKAILAARHMYEIDPYMSIDVRTDGLFTEGAEEFLMNKKPDLIIEEVDNLPLKLEVRKIAKKLHIPVIMVTGNGSNVILDVERYDQEDGLLLNGLLDETVRLKIENQKDKLSFEEHIELARDFIGKKWLTQRLQDSFEQVGKTLAGIPQLGEATFLRGATLAYTARKILLGESVYSGRYEKKLDDLFI